MSDATDFYAPRTNTAGTARTFIDYSDTNTNGDLPHDFAEAVDSARWGDDREGGTLANKETVTQVTDKATDYDFARRLAAEYLYGDNPEYLDPHGPAGAIPVSGDGDEHAWVIFGWAAIEAFPPCRDEAAARANTTSH